jgi:hypothetical protein
VTAEELVDVFVDEAERVLRDMYRVDGRELPNDLRRHLREVALATAIPPRAVLEAVSVEDMRRLVERQIRREFATERPS